MYLLLFIKYYIIFDIINLIECYLSIMFKWVAVEDTKTKFVTNLNHIAQSQIKRNDHLNFNFVYNFLFFLLLFSIMRWDLTATYQRGMKYMA